MQWNNAKPFAQDIIYSSTCLNRPNSKSQSMSSTLAAPEYSKAHEIGRNVISCSLCCTSASRQLCLDVKNQKPCVAYIYIYEIIYNLIYIYILYLICNIYSVYIYSVSSFRSKSEEQNQGQVSLPAICEVVHQTFLSKPEYFAPTPWFLVILGSKHHDFQLCDMCIYIYNIYICMYYISYYNII